jgi:hypothetical protein
LQENGWIAKTNISGDFSFGHMEQFIELWIQLQDTRLDEAMAEDIFGKLSTSDRYSVPWTYKGEFHLAIYTDISKLLWIFLVPPKIKFFAWLPLRNRLKDGWLIG